MQKNSSPSFFDAKTLVAVIAVALVYYGWNTYLGKKYPGYGQPTSTVTDSAEQVESVATSTSNADSKAVIAESEQAPEKTIFFENDKVSFTLTSKGMGIEKFTVKNYQNKKQENIQLGLSDSDSLFEMRWADELSALQFNVSEVAKGHYEGTAVLGETEVKRELLFNEDTGSFTNKIIVKNPGEEFKKGFSLLIPEKIHTQESASFLFPSFEHQDFFVIHNGGKQESINFSNAKEDKSESFSSVSLVSVSSQYFAATILDKSEIIPEVKLSSKVQGKAALAELFYKPSSLKSEMVFSEVFYVGPKSIDILKTVDPEMAQIIDLGFFGFIARPLLYVMKAFHSIVGNWGVAIILLTLLVRLCVLPFNIMSFRSMKAMQKVQPIIQGLREKYKDDTMRLNQEMMKVMKENGANPLGGCLPMLLQIPVFFALYRVIGSSVELYNSPFAGWIHDLSSHDPFYVLPILMAVFMFVQQKITPSTMDPTQAKVMAFLPVVFSLFMLQLPSGLTLYMVVSTLFGIIQQFIIMRDSPAPAAKKA